MPETDAAYDDYRAEDATDRRVAAELAAELSDQLEGFTSRADLIYTWLRKRPTVAPARLILSAGVPINQPEEPVALELDMTDVQEDTFTVGAEDSKGFPTPDGPFTWSEDSAGAVITLAPSADTTSCVATAVAPGNATLTVTDPSGLTGTEAVVVSAGPVASLQVTAGTPTDQPPAGG